MKISIPVMSDLCKAMGTKEVISSAIGATSAEPDPEGLASYDIFGKPGTEERETLYGHINLNAKFIHPQVLAALKGLKREIFRDLIAGTSEFYIENAELKPLKPGTKAPSGSPVGTGIGFLYTNWHKLDFKPRKSDAPATKDRKALISALSKDKIFIDKWLVMPAFYRDVDLHTNKRNRWNAFYVKLIQLSSMIKASSAMMEIYQTTDAHVKIQTTLEDMHREIMQFIGGTKGFIHQHVMGKPTKYSCRLVISSANYSANKEEDLDTNFSKTGMPLHAVNKVFVPFMAYGLKKLVKDVFLQNRDYIEEYNPKTGQMERFELDSNWEEMFSIQNLRKRFDLYEESKIHRLEPVKIRCKDGKERLINYFRFNTETGKYEYTKIEPLVKETSFSDSFEDISTIDTSMPLEPNENDKIIKVPMSWCHLLYMVAYMTVKDKVVYITRYPIEDYNNIYPAEMNIIPSTNTQVLILNGIEFPRFPILPLLKDIDFHNIDRLDHIFVDTMMLHPAYLKALNADFDGDMVSVIPIFTNEANNSAKKYIRTITNTGAIDGGTTRGLSDITAQTIYNITI